MSWEKMEFEALLEVVPDALLGVDEAGVIRFVNRQTESMFGYDHGDLVGKPIETLVPVPLRADHTVHRGEFTAAPSVRRMGAGLTLSGLRRDGNEFPVDIALSHLENEDGRMVIAAVRDMGPSRRAEADRLRAARLLAIVEYSDDAIIDTTPDGIITSWNPAAERIFGYPGAGILGASDDLLTPEDRIDEMASIRVAILAGRRVGQFESTRIRADGKVLTLSIGVSPIRDDKGAVVGISTVAHDVSEAKEAFEAARSMLEASKDSLVAISPEGKITDANEATVKLTGIPLEKLVGTDFSRYFTDPQKADEVYRRAVDDDDPTGVYQLTLRHHNGRETLTEVLYNASVRRDANGNVLGVFAAARDITAASHAFEAARSMLEASLDSLVAISPEGMITDANEATVRLTGVPRERLVGTSFSQYFTDPMMAEAIYQRVFSEGSVADYPLTMRHLNGRQTFTEVLYNASVYRDVDGNVLGAFAAARDMTRQVQAQRAIAEEHAKEQDRLAELEQFQRLTVGRELKMIELKKEIEYLRRLAPGQGPESDPD